MDLNDFLVKKKAKSETNKPFRGQDLLSKSLSQKPVKEEVAKLVETDIVERIFLKKYRPKIPEEIVGQEKAVKEALEFIRNWKKGKALFFSGQPGVGKTLLAELIAEQRDAQLVVMGASDKRTAKEIEAMLSDAVKQQSLFKKGKIILMDEVDGISGHSDRGAKNAIVKIIKESEHPVILIANDAYHPKLSGIKRYCKHIKFSKVRSTSISKYLSEIAKKERIDMSKDIINIIASFSEGDMRSAITDFQTISIKNDPKPEDVQGIIARDRSEDMFSMLSTLFFSGNISASRKALWDAEKDSDEIFYWLETNIPKVFKTSEDLAKAYELLSKADIFRAKVMKQQNWRFKGLMSDLMAGISVRAKPVRGFIQYQFPDKIAQLGRTKFTRAIKKRISLKIGEKTHSSTRRVNEMLPYMKMIARGKEKEFAELFDLSSEEMGTLTNS